MRERPQLRVKLWENAHRLYDGLSQLGFAVSPEVSPVVAVTIRERSQAIAWWDELMQRGAYVNLVMPPASPTTDSLLRCSVSAAHSSEQIDQIIEAFAALKPSASASDPIT